jgi:hypothetical protein
MGKDKGSKLWNGDREKKREAHYVGGSQGPDLRRPARSMVKDQTGK